MSDITQIDRSYRLLSLRFLVSLFLKTKYFLCRIFYLTSIVSVGTIFLPVQKSLAEGILTDVDWQQCAALPETVDAQVRLACYNQWAARQRQNLPTNTDQVPPLSASQAELTDTENMKAVADYSATAVPVNKLAKQNEATILTPTLEQNQPTQDGSRIIVLNNDGCRNPSFNATDRLWELDRDTDCGTFRLRGYKPIGFAFSFANKSNNQPYAPTADGGLTPFQKTQKYDAQIQLSMRTKLLTNFLTQADPFRRDALWFAYSVKSDWQIFNEEASRPFRNTNHEPELIYSYPVNKRVANTSIHIRYLLLGLNHQSNGRSDPYSRSWNRAFLNAGIDFSPHFHINARIWHRFKENPLDDDNPDIMRHIGRAQLTAYWQATSSNSFIYTHKSNLKNYSLGSNQLEWLHALGKGFAGGRSNLLLHTTIFNGFGDSLLDYNFRKSVLKIGFSLTDF